MEAPLVPESQKKPELDSEMEILLGVAREFATNKAVQAGLATLEQKLVMWKAGSRKETHDGVLWPFLDAAKRLAEDEDVVFYLPGGSGVIRADVKRDKDSGKVQWMQIDGFSSIDKGRGWHEIETKGGEIKQG